MDPRVARGRDDLLPVEVHPVVRDTVAATVVVGGWAETLLEVGSVFAGGLSQQRRGKSRGEDAQDGTDSGQQVLARKQVRKTFANIWNKMKKNENSTQLVATFTSIGTTRGPEIVRVIVVLVFADFILVATCCDILRQFGSYNKV